MVNSGSVAGYRGLPRGQPYSATKAALINFAESLRAEVAGNGIDVKIINPGFVHTPMTDQNSFKMPMVIEADEYDRQGNPKDCPPAALLKIEGPLRVGGTESLIFILCS